MAKQVIKGIVLDEHVVYTLEEVCDVCSIRSEWVVELVELGVLQPRGRKRRDWRFAGDNLHTAMKARRLQRDFDLNLAGVALVLELLDEIEALRNRLAIIEQ